MPGILRICRWLVLLFSSSAFSAERLSQKARPELLILPQDIFVDSTARTALQALRQSPREAALYAETLRTDQRDYATLTLVGNKGGELHEQINQDRSFVWLSPPFVVSGVLDGHGVFGHFAAEHARHSLLQHLRGGIEPGESVAEWLRQAFIEADAHIPDPIADQGGATCSIAIQYNGQLYFANAGDSQSFLVAVVIIDGKVVDTKIVYQTRLDTPEVPEEKARLLKAGATVHQEDEDDLRVWSQDEKGEWNGLAMSRGFGDRGAKAVIAEPVVEVLNIQQVLLSIVEEYKPEDCQINIEGETAYPVESITAAQVRLFCVSATDGIMDSLKPEYMGEQLAPSMYEATDIHLLVAIENLMLESAKAWNDDMEGQYRDDMAIAIAKVQ